MKTAISAYKNALSIRRFPHAFSKIFTLTHLCRLIIRIKASANTYPGIKNNFSVYFIAAAIICCNEVFP
jgi:hypothetical protein